MTLFCLLLCSFAYGWFVISSVDLCQCVSGLYCSLTTQPTLPLCDVNVCNLEAFWPAVVSGNYQTHPTIPLISTYMGFVSEWCRCVWVLCLCVCIPMHNVCLYVSLIYQCCLAVLRLLKEGVDPNTPISSGGSLLHLVKSSVITKVH